MYDAAAFVPPGGDVKDPVRDAPGRVVRVAVLVETSSPEAAREVRALASQALAVLRPRAGHGQAKVGRAALGSGGLRPPWIDAAGHTRHT